MGEFAVYIEHLEAKSVSASGGLRPALPLDPAGGSAPRPSLIGSHSLIVARQLVEN